MNKPRRSHRPLYIAGIVLLAGSAIGAGWVLNHSPAEDGYNSGRDRKEPLPPGIVCIGFADVDGGIAQLYPLQQGRVKQVVEEGKPVHKGDVLLQLEDRLQELDHRRAQADLDAARQQLARAKLLPEQRQKQIAQQQAAFEAARFQKVAAEQELEIKNKLFADKQLSLQEKRVFEEQAKRTGALVQAEEAKLDEVKILNPEIDILRAQADVQAKEARLEKAQVAVEECKLAAPADGTVLRVQVSVGEVLGSNPKQAALQFAPNGARIIRAEVLQEWASRIQEGQEALIEDDTRSGNPQWTGKVKRISDWFSHRRNIILEPFQFNDVRTLECIVEVTPGGPPLRIGQRVRVTVRPSGT